MEVKPVSLGGSRGTNELLANEIFLKVRLLWWFIIPFSDYLTNHSYGIPVCISFLTSIRECRLIKLTAVMINENT